MNKRFSIKNKIGGIKTFVKKLRFASNRKVKYIFAALSILLILGAYAYFWFGQNKYFHNVLGDMLQKVDFDIYLYIMLFTICVFLLALAVLIYKIIDRKISRAFMLKFLALEFVVIFVGVGIFLQTYYFTTPKIIALAPVYNQSIASYNDPIYVKFNVPVIKDKLVGSFVTELEGEWVWESYLGTNLTREGYFSLSKTPFPEQRFVLYIKGINRLFENKNHEDGSILYSVQLPKVVNSNIEGESTKLAKYDKINIQFDKSSKTLADINITISPSVEHTQVWKDNGVEIAATNGFVQGIEYKVTVEYQKLRYNLNMSEVIERSNLETMYEFDFSVANEPGIELFSPNGDKVLDSSQIEISFVDEMYISSVLKNISITPSIEGNWVATDSRNYKFMNTGKLPKDTYFEVIINKNVRSLQKGVLESDAVFKFKTIGKVDIDWISPNSGATGISEFESIAIQFNQAVNKENAQGKFQISPAVDGQFYWDGDKLIFDPYGSLAFSTTYNIKLAQGVESIYGLNSDADFNFNFTVRPNMVLFSVPMYFQSTSFSCNIFTAKMILASKGVYVDHVSLISTLGYNESRNGDSWSGNPYYEYVGNADGSWGYGAYAPAIQRLLSLYGVYSEQRSGWSVSDLARSLQQGRPVIIWRYNGVGGGQNISWTSTDGTYVYAFNGMHGTVISGFIGPADNPTSFYVNDPWQGQFWMSAATLDAYWSYSGRMALEIF